MRCKTVKTAVSASCRGGPMGANSLLIGADLHRAMVATTPGEKLLMGRRPVKSGTRSIRYQAWFFVQKITLVLRKINKNCCHQSCTYFLTTTGTKSFVGWGFVPDLTVGSLQRSPDPLAVFKGPASKRRGEERREDIT